MTGKTLFASLAAGGVVLLLAACDEDKYTLKFSHHLHVTENEMSCDECHGELGQPSFTALSHETCSDCHAAIHRFVPSEKELGRSYNTKDALLAHPEIATFVAWVSTQRADRRFPTRTKRKRR